MESGISIDIDALVIANNHSFDAERFSGALRGELTRLLSHGLPRSGVWQVDGVRIELANHSDSVALGVQVAQIIYAQL